MEEIKKKLYRTGAKSVGSGVVFLLIGFLFLVIGIVLSALGTDYKPFNNRSGGYVTLEALFVEGPFAELSDDKGKADKLFWTVYDADFNEYVLQTGPTCSLPVYGEDITTDEEIAALYPETIKGKSVKIPQKLIPFLVDWYADYDMNQSNYGMFVGTYMIDTTNKSNSAGTALLVFGVILLLAGILIFIILSVQNASLRKKMDDPQMDIRLQQVYQDFASHPDAIYSQKLRAAVSPSYLVDFNAGKDTFRIIPLADMVNAFQCNMVNGNPTAASYIAVENASDRYLFAETLKVSPEFNGIIAYLKRNITTGGQQI